MNNHSKTESQLKIPVIAVIYGAVAVFLGSTVIAHLVADIPFSFFSSDPLSLFEAHPLTGIQSNLGVLTLVSTASICLFTAIVLRSKHASASDFQFFLWSGLITFVLTLDDLFLIHEDLAIRYLEMGQKTVFVLYIIVIGRYIFKLRRTIPHSDHTVFILAIVFLGLSETIDSFRNFVDSPWGLFVEDGLKLFGIVSWSIYLIRESFRFIKIA